MAAASATLLSAVPASLQAISYNTTITFDDPVPLSPTQTAGAWYPDRYAPASFEKAVFGGDNRLHLAIDGNSGVVGRGSPYDSTFYNTHGRKLDLPTGSYAVEAKVFVPSDWLSAGSRRRSDIWGSAVDAANGTIEYPIIGVANVSGTAVFRYWDSSIGWVVVPSGTFAVSGNTWYTLGFQLKAGNLVYTINGTEVGSVVLPAAVGIANAMLQAYNFNDPTLDPSQQSPDSYDVYWDDLSYAFPQVRNVTDGINFATIGAAIAAATTGAGDVIQLNGGVYTEAPVNINKAVTIQGPNAGISGTAARANEARILNTKLTITAAGAVVDGVEIFRNDAVAGDAVLIQAASEFKNSVIRRNGSAAGTIARGITTSNGTGVTISGNLFTGDPSGSFFSGHKTWQSGIYSNGGGTTISGNTFENCRAALNLDDFNAGIVVTGNSFRNSGTYIAFGGVTPTAGSHTIAGNDFDINFATPGLPSGFFNNSNVASSFRLNATGNTFGGIASTALTDAQKFVMEPRMNHRGREGRNGVVDYVAGQQVVVAGTTIASAIDAAAASDTVLVGPGTFNEDVALNKAVTLHGTGAGSTTLSGPIGGDSATVRISASGAILDGFTITRAGNNTTDWNNPNLNSAGVAIQGLSITGTVISNNEITGNRSAIDINSSNGHTVRNNVIANNHTGVIFRNQTDSMTVVENSITANRTVGILFLDASGGSNSPVQTAAGSTFSNNSISGNWYGQVVDRQSGGSIPAPGTNGKNFESNWFGTTTPVVTTANSAELAYAALIPVAFGGTATAPGGQPDIAGPASANIDFAPLLASGTDTNVETTPGRGTYGFQGNTAETVDGLLGTTTISTPRTFGDLYIPAGSTVTVTPTGSITAGSLNLGPGSTLVVNGGSLTIGDSTIAGTFTIFNSFGSFNINDDTTFTIGQSLALITDIHVAAGKTITVNGGGELVLDGCVINSQTPGSSYNISVASNGLLTLARSAVTDANIDIDTLAGSVPANLKSKVYDNSFTSSAIEASAASAVYHNLFDAATNGAANTGATTAFDDVDSWGNVTNADNLLNKFTLNFAPPADTTRTLDSDGNLFVQTADPVVLKIDVGNLSPNSIVAAEALLGYNSNRLTLVSGNPAVTPTAGWQVLVDDDSVASPLGLVDSALGLNLAGPGDDGISGPANIANVNFTAGTEGLSVGFFRVQTNRQFDDNGVLIKDTRLTKSTGGAPSYLTPFTANTGEIVVDNQDPAIATISVTGVQTQPSAGSVNVLDPANRVFRTGNAVTLTFTATDAGLAGLDAADAANDLVFTANNGVTELNSANYTLAAAENTPGVVTYTITLNVPATATVGTYNLTASVIDRSGNSSGDTALGSFIIANEVNVSVELQAFAGTSRDVVFKATNSSGTVLKTWTKTVTGITGSIGSVNLEDVPAGTVAISAKTAWTLRNKRIVSFSPEGLASTALTGAAYKLKGGDLNGDNVINTLDYGILRFHFNSTNPTARLVADITGDVTGEVNLTDFNVMQANFYTVGSAQ